MRACSHLRNLKAFGRDNQNNVPGSSWKATTRHCQWLGADGPPSINRARLRDGRRGRGGVDGGRGRDGCSRKARQPTSNEPAPSYPVSRDCLHLHLPSPTPAFTFGYTIVLLHSVSLPLIPRVCRVNQCLLFCRLRQATNARGYDHEPSRFPLSDCCGCCPSAGLVCLISFVGDGWPLNVTIVYQFDSSKLRLNHQGALSPAPPPPTTTRPHSPALARLFSKPTIPSLLVPAGPRRSGQLHLPTRRSIQPGKTISFSPLCPASRALRSAFTQMAPHCQNMVCKSNRGFLALALIYLYRSQT